MRPVDAKEVLDLVIQSVYYSADLEVETAYLLSNDEGTFALIGKPQTVNFVEETTSFVPETADEEESDDLDFDSL